MPIALWPLALPRQAHQDPDHLTRLAQAKGTRSAGQFTWVKWLWSLLLPCPLLHFKLQTQARFPGGSGRPTGHMNGHE